MSTRVGVEWIEFCARCLYCTIINIHIVRRRLSRLRRLRHRARRWFWRSCGHSCVPWVPRSQHWAPRRACWLSFAQCSSLPFLARQKWDSESLSQSRYTRGLFVCATSCGTRARCSPISLCYRRKKPHPDMRPSLMNRSREFHEIQQHKSWIDNFDFCELCETHQLFQ